jgi:hypothetical protein
MPYEEVTELEYDHLVSCLRFDNSGGGGGGKGGGALDFSAMYAARPGRKAAQAKSTGAMALAGGMGVGVAGAGAGSECYEEEVNEVPDLFCDSASCELPQQLPAAAATATAAAPPAGSLESILAVLRDL